MNLSEYLAELPRYQEKKEITSYTPIENLFVLIHPLDQEFGRDIVWKNYTVKNRKLLFDNAISHFIPKSPNDVLVIVPNMGPTPEDCENEIIRTESQMDLFDDPYSWLTIFDYAKAHAISPNNVFLGDNIPEVDIPSTLVEAQLKGRGFSIMSDTKIKIGGELIENCIADTAMDFLSLLHVPSVLIDRWVSLGLAEYAKHGPIPQTTLQTTKRWLRTFGYKVTEEGDRYLRVVRP